MGRLKNQGDLDVIVEGKVNPTGKRVGPYARLLTYDGGETINAAGRVGWKHVLFVRQRCTRRLYRRARRRATKDQSLAARDLFWRNGSACWSRTECHCQRSESRNRLGARGNAPGTFGLLRKLPKFGQVLDETYRRHGLGRVLEDLSEEGSKANEAIVGKLRDVGRFMSYGKHHVLCQETEPIENIVLIKSVAGSDVCVACRRPRRSECQQLAVTSSAQELSRA